MPSNPEPNHGRKRAKIDRDLQDQRLSTVILHQREKERTTVLPSSNPAADAAAMSFEAKIGLALKGSNWQELQINAPAMAVTENDGLARDNATSDIDAARGDAEIPKEMTAKQKKKMERFGQTIAKDAGEVLQVIEVDALDPVPQNVTWDRDPELLCCYNWQASTDGTNTIFGQYWTLIVIDMTPKLT